jgi:hypothetical protein
MRLPMGPVAVRKAVTCCAVVVLAAGGVVAQQPIPSTRAPAVPTVAERRERLHEALRRYPQPHDAYIELAEIGSRESIPLLLRRFALDMGT